MTTRILVFDPTNADEIEQKETEIDELLSDGWTIQSTVSHNRPGSKPKGTFQTAADGPVERGYLVMILYKKNPPKKLKASVRKEGPFG